MKKLLATVMAAIGLVSGTWAATIDLSTVKSDIRLVNGDIITGSLNGEYKITIAAGASVKLKNAYIYGVDSKHCPWAGLTCEGDADIYIEDVNVVRGFYKDYPGIYVPLMNKLSIGGTGTLIALNNGRGAGIGGGDGLLCGDIKITSGTVIALGGEGAAGIGSGGDSDGGTNFCAGITIWGTVVAVGGAGAAGIGSGKGAICSSVYINFGNVEATGGAGAAGIGAGQGGRCSEFVAVGPLVNYISATAGEGCSNALGAGNGGTCDSIQIYEGDDPPGLLRRDDGPTTILASKRLKLGSAPMDMTLLDGMIVTGTLTADQKISIAPDAMIELQGVTINGVNSESCKWAGLTCQGNAKIILDGENTVKGFYEDYPGIFVPPGSGLTITVMLKGSLRASSNGYGAGIGGGYKLDCGSVCIMYGTIDVWGGKWAAGIGSGYKASAGQLTVAGGTVNVAGGAYAAGIGTGKDASCTAVSVVGGNVNAMGCNGAAAIGSGEGGTCRDFVGIGLYVTHVAALGGATCVNPIGAGKNGTCGPVDIDEDLLDETEGLLRTISTRNLQLDTLTADTKILDGMVVSGMFKGNYKLTIAAGATVTLLGATINGTNIPGFRWAGLTCEGDATIILEGKNSVRGFYEDYPGIYVPVGKTLTIKGTGSLDASSNGYAAGIGAGYEISCGNIVLEGGTINATGGRYAAGIGGAMQTSCGTIAVKDGIIRVTATSGVGGRPIGSGQGGEVTVDPGLIDTTVDSTRTIKKANDNWNGDLSTLQGDAVARDGLHIYGTLNGNYKVSIAAGATVTLSAVTIDGSAYNSQNCPWAGLTCEDDATIILKGSNMIKGFYEDYPGIYVPKDSTLTIKGSGSLDASSNGHGAGIGGGYKIDCGNIVIEGGTITATGGSESAGIGGGYQECVCGDIVISGGYVTAKGGYQGAAGIGGGTDCMCGTITIGSGIARVEATCGIGCNNPIGCGGGGWGGTVYLADGLSETTTGSTTVIEKGGTSGGDDPGPVQVAKAEFEFTDIMVNEGDTASIVVKGGSANEASSVKVYLTYNTAVATDVDWAKGAVGGTTPTGGLKFPLTLEWAAGDTSPKTITVPVKADTTVENNEFFTLQLADATGMGVGEAKVCNVTIHDERYDELAKKIESGKATKAEKSTWNNLQKAQVPYIRGLADPADGGKVTGSGPCAGGGKVTLKATANKNFTFMGWFDEDGKIVAETATLVIDRTTKPAASTSTSTTITGVAADVTYYAFFMGDPQLLINVVATDNTGAEPTGTGLGKYKAGTVTGMGRYVPGKKATVKAKANAGYVFAGWYDMDEHLISLSESYPFEMVDADTTLTARFITVEQDKNNVEAVIDEAFLYDSQTSSYETSVPAGVYLEWPLAVTALSKTTVAVSGLPTGLKFTAKDIVDSKTKEVIIPANTIYGTPTAASKVERNTGNTVPSKVKITITTAGKNKLEFSLLLTVTPLPAWAIGTFEGGGTDGQATLTISANGKMSGKYLTGGQTWTLSATNFDEFYEDDGIMRYNYTAKLTAKAGRLSKTFRIFVFYDPDEDTGGTAYVDDENECELFRLFQTDWKVEPWKTIGTAINGKTFEYEAVDLGENDGTMKLRFASTGKITAKCEFVTGKDPKTQKDIVYSATGSAVLAGPLLISGVEGSFSAKVYIYFPPKPGKFDGYMSDFELEWDGKKFERD